MGFGEAAIGVSVAAADSDYRRFEAASFKFSLRGGVEFWRFKRIGFAPELQIDLIPVHTNDGSYRPVTIGGIPLYTVDTPFARYRFLAGGRVLFDFGIGAAFVRVLVGVDYLTGSEEATALTGGFSPGGLVVNVRFHFASTAFTFQPGIGVQFRFRRYGIAGLSIDLPVAFHDFGRKDAAGVQSFTAFQVDLLGTIGFRL